MVTPTHGRFDPMDGADPMDGLAVQLKNSQAPNGETNKPHATERYCRTRTKGRD
jgi:hypothetical protein